MAGYRGYNGDCGLLECGHRLLGQEDYAGFHLGPEHEIVGEVEGKGDQTQPAESVLCEYMVHDTLTRRQQGLSVKQTHI